MSLSEVWRPIPGYEGRYEVSNLGRARSLARVEMSAIGRRVVPARVLRPMLNGEGYAYIGLRIEGHRRMLRLHRIVAEVFVPGQNIIHRQAAHLDGNRANARADNLKWVSPRENAYHKRAHGTHQSGDRAANRILTSAEVDQIRRRGATAPILAGRYGVSPHTIYDIWQGKRWKPASAVPRADEADAQP